MSKTEYVDLANKLRAISSALQYDHRGEWGVETVGPINQAANAISQHAAKCDPVAWRVRYKRAPDYWIIFQHYPTDAAQDPEREVFPLYAGAEPIGKAAS